MAKVRFSRRAKGVVSVITGALCLLVAGLLLNRAYALADGRNVEGRVTAVHEDAIEVRYPAIRQAQTKTFHVGGEVAKTLRIGRRVPVVVVSDDEAYLLGDGPSALPIVTLCLLSVALIGGGAVVYLKPAA